MPASRELFSSNAFGLMGLESVGGYHPAKLRAYQDLLDANLISQPAVLKMLNVRYILSPSPIRWAVDAAYQADGCVYPWPDSLPRAWAVSRVETVSGFEQVRSRLGGADFDPAQTALVYSGDAPAGGEAFAPAEVRLVGRRAGRVRLSTQSDGTAFVVVSEPAFPPGWKATVDGKTAPIHRVNHVLQGIEVPAGSHEVQLTMHSRARVAGARVSRVAGTIAFLLALTCVIVPRLVRGRADAAARGRAD
jgi:hypothetical protein